MATKKKKKKPAPPDVPVKVDATLKRLYDKLVAAITSASRGEMQDFDARWEAAAAVIEHDPPLYVFGGFKDQNEFFVEVMKEEPRTARRYLRVAKYASPQDEGTWGITKLDAALAFIEAKMGKPLVHPPLPVALAKLRIPVGKENKSLAEASVAEITAATAKLTSGLRKKPKTAAETALAKAVTAVASLKEVHVSERAGKVSFEGVPLAALGKFARVLLAAKLPD